MSEQFTNEPLLDMFLFETEQLLEQLEQSILNNEKDNDFGEAAINEIFRIMHTIKGSAAMMLFDNIAKVAHSIEDIFFSLRKEKPVTLDYSVLSDLVLEGVDFIKVEVEKIKSGNPADGTSEDLVESMREYLLRMQNDIAKPSSGEPSIKEEKHQYYIGQLRQKQNTEQNTFKATLRFEDGCEMENIRAYTVIHNLTGIATELSYFPSDIIDSDESIFAIRENGFQIYIKTEYDYQKLYNHLNQTIFLRDLELTQVSEEAESLIPIKESVKETVSQEAWKEEKSRVNSSEMKEKTEKEVSNSNVAQSIISVSVSKLDKLMDLVGEMVIAEAMVVQNPDLDGLSLDNFKKASRQLSKITSDIQDMVMSIRMVPLSATFNKMHRIVRDMNKKLGKEVQLEIIGEETEVDKNIIEHISDPLMHLVRNAIDHGIELPQDRQNKGKSKNGTVVLEAKNAGSDVHILIRDDGMGLDKEKILKKARENRLIYKNEEDMTDKEIFNLILLPGFSTNENVTEFSGRGVGMDVVSKNIESVGGTLSVESVANKGSVFLLKIPLTLAIIDGMNIKVGKARYTLPTIAIKESFRPKPKDILKDPDGNEMIMVRGQCYLIKRLHEMFKVETTVTNFDEGIIIMLEQDGKTVCIFADELIGQQQVVVKALPNYIRNLKRVKGLAGCTLLGDGSISLILDVAQLVGR
ncbi:MAG: chemotaxis protein CheA [Mobilitalea sp.]